jgi:hypothetical protein
VNQLQEPKKKHLNAVADLIEQGRIVVKVLDEAQLGRFLRYNELVMNIVKPRAGF